MITNSTAPVSTAILAGTISQIADARSSDERLDSLRRLVNEATATIHEIEGAARLFTAELEHPRHGIFKIGVDPDSLAGTVGSLLDISLALLTTAARTAAARTIDGRSFDTQEEHDEAIQKRSSAFQIIGIRHSADAERWFVQGHTATGEPFETYVHAVDYGEADFQARWHAATSRQSAPVRLDDLPAFLGRLYEVTIDSLVPKPVDLDELAATSSGLVTYLSTVSPFDSVQDVLASPAFANLKAMLAKITTASQYTQPAASAPTSLDQEAQPLLEDLHDVGLSPAAEMGVDQPLAHDESQPRAVSIDLP